MAREIIKPVFSRPREIRVLSQEDWSLTTDFSFYSKTARRKRRVSVLGIDTICFFIQHIMLFIMLFFCSNYAKKYAFCPTLC